MRTGLTGYVCAAATSASMAPNNTIQILSFPFIMVSSSRGPPLPSS